MELSFCSGMTCWRRQPPPPGGGALSTGLNLTEQKASSAASGT